MKTDLGPPGGAPPPPGPGMRPGVQPARVPSGGLPAYERKPNRAAMLGAVLVFLAGVIAGLSAFQVVLTVGGGGSLDLPGLGKKDIPPIPEQSVKWIEDWKGKFLILPAAVILAGIAVQWFASERDSGGTGKLKFAILEGLFLALAVGLAIMDVNGALQSSFVQPLVASGQFSVDQAETILKTARETGVLSIEWGNGFKLAAGAAVLALLGGVLSLFGSGETPARP